ncbi:Zinc finger GRF-type protein [Arachis hypogaea]|nr:Zinc finger GRF-type protein [Arachis hypogaea]
MMRSTSQGSGSCNRSHSHGSLERNPNRARSGKVPHWCGCGMRPVLRWSGTEANPERPFFGCPNYNSSGNRWCELFVWANGVEEEDMIGRHETENSIEYWKMNVGWKISAIEAEIRNLKIWNSTLSFFLVLFVVVAIGYALGVRK